MRKTLPPKYYLDHFFEFLDFIKTHYIPMLSERDIQFLNQFQRLSQNAQCAYIRMVNRKGGLFEKKGFEKYTEIDNISKALDELRVHHFISSVTAQNHLELLTFLTKPRLLKWLSACEVLLDYSQSSKYSRDELVEIGRQQITKLDYLKLPGHQELLLQGYSDSMQYLLFLYFGRLQKTLTLYTLRDLEIRQSDTLKNSFKPRFSKQKQARAEYFFAVSLEINLEWCSIEEIEQLYINAMTYQDLPTTTQHLKDELLLGLADFALANSQVDIGLLCLQESQHTQSREILSRTLYKLDQKERCQKVLEDIILQPRSDQELLFAEDFLSRKFNKKRRSYLSEVLHNAKEISLSYFYLKRPEEGVCQHFKNRGARASFTENKFWCSLFGLLFWNELFESELSAIHNPFERAPSDLIGETFYLTHHESLETILSNLKESQTIEKHLSQIAMKNYGRLNDIFIWQPQLVESALHFLRSTRSQNVAYVLRALAKNFLSTRSGFPDLMIEQDDQYSFVEVKAEGDTLRASQLARIHLLKEAGFEVEILKVRWENDPQQTYVVVDVETTGGSSSFHRITEIGAVKIKNGQVIDEFQTLIHPGRPIPEFITSITGITNEMVAQAPRFAEIAHAFLDFISGSIFVAHNVKFDYGFIQKEFARSEIEFTRPHLCTCSGMKKSHPGLRSYGLKNLAEHFKIPLEQHHRALSDARAAAHLFILMNQDRDSAPELH